MTNQDHAHASRHVDGLARFSFRGGAIVATRDRPELLVTDDQAIDGRVWIGFRLGADAFSMLWPKRVAIASDAHCRRALSALASPAPAHVVGLIEIAPDLIERTTSMLPSMTRSLVPLPVQAEPDRVESTLIEGMARLAYSADHRPCTTLFAEQTAALLLVHMLRRHGSLSDLLANGLNSGYGVPRACADGPKGRGGCDSLQRALDQMEADLSEKLELSAIADSIGVSVAQFARSFRSELGLSPWQWVLNRRVDKARELLQTTRLSLADIAYATGFSSQAHMTSTFTRMLGTTPGKLRKESVQ